MSAQTDWKNAVPPRWEVRRLRFFCQSIQTGSTPSQELLDCSADDPDTIDWFTPGDFGDSLKLRDSSRKVPVEAGRRGEVAIFPPQTVLVVGIGATLGKVGLIRQPAAANQQVNAILPRPDVHGELLAWTLSALNEVMRAMANNATLPILNQQRMGDLQIAIPPLEEQRAIADYLDRETARLDALVAAKERLLGLLAEKRRALITRAVTRGLDPRAPLRDSGIPWLGEIPAHWERAQLRRFIRFITSGSRGWAEHYSDSGSIFVRIGNLTRDSIRVDLSDIQYVDPPRGAEGERTRIQADDLLFSITAYLGSVAVAPSTLVDAYVNQHIALVRLDTSNLILVPEFIGYAALSDAGQSQLAGQAYGGTKTQLALDDIKELWFPVPPMPEQRAIVVHIAAETAKLDALRSATERTIALLKERRAALIAAAVTGRLDVPELRSGSASPRSVESRSGVSE